jgi:hypothetical protein
LYWWRLAGYGQGERVMHHGQILSSRAKENQGIQDEKSLKVKVEEKMAGIG